MLDDLAVVEVERRVLHQQPDQLAVGDVDHRLALLGEPVAGLRVGQRPLLEEAVEVRAGDDHRLALLERAAHADVPVGQGEHRLVHRERGVVEPDLGQRPRLDREARASFGHALSPSSSRGRYDDVGPGWPPVRRHGPRDRRRRRSRSSPPGPPQRRTIASSKTTAARGLGTPSRRAPARKVSGAGLPRSPSRAATTPSTRTSMRSANPAAAMTFSPLADAVTTAVRQARPLSPRAGSAPSPGRPRPRARRARGAPARSSGSRSPWTVAASGGIARRCPRAA